MKRLLLTVFILFISILTFAQDKSNFGINFSGFVKTDMIFDTRQNVTAREGHFNLYPKFEDMTFDDEDINGKDNFNILSIQTRLKGTITGPDAFGAKTSALIEGAFFGHTEGDINGFRLRHAFAKLSWTNTELLIGQYWHAMFITECFPGTVSFNTGAPFQPFSRNPQVRLSHKVNNFKFVLTAMTQRDFTSKGPGASLWDDPVVNSSFLRNRAIPELNFTIKYHKKNQNNEFLVGAGANFLSLVPINEYFINFGTKKGTVDAFSFLAFMKYKSENITWKLEGVMGENTHHLTMLGGYAYTSDIDKPFQPSRTLSIWTDIHSNGKKIQYGVFAGYTKNNGIKDINFVNEEYGRSFDIDYVYRVSPRIMFNSGKMRFAGEIEYTAAAYGNKDHDLSVENSEEVANLRVLVGVYYFF